MGNTSLINGERRSKSDLIFEVLGDLDELSSSIGIVRSILSSTTKERAYQQELNTELLVVQRLLIPMGGQIATPPPKTSPYSISQVQIDQLEGYQIERMKGMSLKGFIIPGALTLSAALDMARAISRRAERHLVRYIGEQFAQHLQRSQIYLNRLSDYLFVAAREAVMRAGIDET